MPTATFPGVYKSLEPIANFVEIEAKKLPFTDKELYGILLAVDEACANIIDHAYCCEGAGDIKVTVTARRNHLFLQFEDKGSPCALDDVQMPDLSSPLEERSERGLGVYTMRKMMDEVKLERVDGMINRLTMKKSKRRA